MILLLWMNKKSDWIDLLQTFRGFSVFFGNLLVWILIGVAFLMGILSRSYITQYNIHICSSKYIWEVVSILWLCNSKAILNMFYLLEYDLVILKKFFSLSENCN